MNVIADDLSRAGQILPTEWSLHQDMANHVFNIWEHPNVDLFVTWYNHKCPTFVSTNPDVRTLDTVVLTIDWEGMFAFAFPSPQQILTKILWKFRQIQNCSLLQIAPFGSKQSVVSGPLDPLPPWDKLLKQPWQTCITQTQRFSIFMPGNCHS